MSDSNGAEVSQWMVKETLAEHLAPLLEHYDVKWRGYGIIYVNHEHYNIDTARRILSDLSASLGVWTHLVRSRLVDLGWLNDVRDALPVRDDVARIFDNLASRATDEPEMDEEYDED